MGLALVYDSHPWMRGLVALLLVTLRDPLGMPGQWLRF